MKTIPLTRGFVAIVDDEDYAGLSAYKWFANHKGYACRQSRTAEGAQQCIRMHRQILNAPPDLQVDHIDGNKQNNTRTNLRLCTAAQNSQNYKRPVTNKSGYKGVHWDKKSKKWRVNIDVNGKRKHIGFFIDLMEAAKARDEAAKLYHKDFARLNFGDAA